MASLIAARACRGTLALRSQQSHGAARYKSSKSRKGDGEAGPSGLQDVPAPRPAQPIAEKQDNPPVPAPASESSSAPASGSVPTLSLDFSPEEKTAAPAGRTGAKSSRDSLSSIEKRRRVMSRFVVGAVGVGLAFGIFYLGRDWESYERPTLSPDLLDANRWGRTKARLTDTTDVFSKPQWKELLPPPQPAPHQKPYTLCLSLDDLLITSVWDRQQGWRTAKRPGVDYFLAYLSQFYEVVIFTSQPHYTALPIVDLLDRYRFFLTYHLFRESTRVADGKIVKDLSYLNRDLKKVILIDTKPDHIYTHPENSILLPPWRGDAKTNKGLVGLIPFLESIAFFAPDDVRPILTAYQGKDIAVEYAKQEAKEKEKFLEELRSKGGVKRGASNLSFTGLFSTPQFPSTTEPLTFLEKRRREAQLMYAREQQYLKDNAEMLEKARQEEIDKQMQMSGSLMGWLESMGGKRPDLDSEKPPVSDKPLPLVGSQSPQPRSS